MPDSGWWTTYPKPNAPSGQRTQRVAATTPARAILLFLIVSLKVYDGYCSSYPSCLHAKPTIQVENGTTILEKIKTKYPKASVDDINTVAAWNVDGENLIIINKDFNDFQYVLTTTDIEATSAKRYSVTLMILPRIMSEEFFHLDINPRSEDSIYHGKKYNTISGFTFVRKQDNVGIGIIEEAAASITARDLLAKMDMTKLDLKGKVSEKEADALDKLMKEKQVSVEQMIQFHRTSDLHGFLALLYPQYTADQRINILLSYFTQEINK